MNSEFDIKKAFLILLERHAADVIEAYDKSRVSLISSAREKRYIINQIKSLGIPHDELPIVLQSLLFFEDRDTDDQYAGYIESANRIVDFIFDKDPYEGRDAKCFIKTLFEKIDPELLSRYERKE